MCREGHTVVVPMDALMTSAASRSWIHLECTVEATVLDVDKSANLLHQKVQIHARDLRILDPLLSYPSAILGRERAIVVNLEHIKAIITAEEVFLRDSTTDNVIPIVEELKKRLPPAGKEGESPTFEFRALEVALEAICNFLDKSTTKLEAASYPALDELTSKISSRSLDGVCKLKIEMARLTACAQKVRDVLKQLLDDDDKMAELYLSRKMASSPSISGRATTFCGDEKDVKELKMLLEAYFMEADRTLNKLTTLREDVDVTVEYKLKNHRNQSIHLEHLLNAGTFCQTILTQVTGVFGMNIPFTWSHAPYGFMFKWVVIVPVVVSAAVFGLIMSYARGKGLVG
ncbi:hypothetical protein MKX01_005405 [Papaver californicum]|nr:hypothetical protein MKX01_005405 [Papaver californicum]